MKKVFISGSIDIKELSDLAKQSIKKIVNNKFTILVGDAYGIDFLVQKYLSEINYTNVIVYSIKRKARNFLNDSFHLKTIDYENNADYLSLCDEEKKEIEYSERKKQFFKDIAMVNDTDYLLAIWDGKSEGTKSNIINGIKLNKQVKVYISEEILPKHLITVESIEKIYEDNSGIGFKELKDRFNEILGSDNIPSSELLKKYKALQKIYPYSSKSFLDGLTDYKNYLILTSYRGNSNIKYKPSIMEKLKSDYSALINSIPERNLLFK